VNPDSSATADPAATPPLPPGAPGNLQPAAIPVMAGTPRVDWSIAFKAAALTGLLAGVPSSLRFISAGCCLWVIGGSALAIMMYQKWKPGGLVSTGMGARIGAVSGFFAFVFWLLFQVVVVSARGTDEFRRQLMQQMQEQAAKNPDPNAQRMMQQMATPEGVAIVITVMVAVVFLAFIVFGVIGGTIGASIWGKRQTS
jgi:hypothetical protein